MRALEPVLIFHSKEDHKGLSMAFILNFIKKNKLVPGLGKSQQRPNLGLEEAPKGFP
jgi:hypothetical protein